MAQQAEAVDQQTISIAPMGTKSGGFYYSYYFGLRTIKGNVSPPWRSTSKQYACLLNSLFVPMPLCFPAVFIAPFGNLSVPKSRFFPIYQAVRAKCRPFWPSELR